MAQTPTRWQRLIRLWSWAPLGLLCYLLIGCWSDADTPYLEFKGGGFIFNYRIAEASYGFVATVARPLPDNSELRARFENPSGGEPFVVTLPVGQNQTRYTFNSPPLRNVRAGRDYRVALQVVDRASQQVLANYERTFRSTLDQTILSDQTPLIGPGYLPNQP